AGRHGDDPPRVADRRRRRAGGARDRWLRPRGRRRADRHPFAHGPPARLIPTSAPTERPTSCRPSTSWEHGRVTIDTGNDHALQRIAVRTCPLCEAGCGLEITLEPRDDGTEAVKRI